MRLFAVILLITALSAFTSCADRLGKIEESLAEAKETGQFQEVTALADSLMKDSADVSAENLAALSVVYIEISNRAVETDSAAMARHAMEAYRALYRRVLNQDSTVFTEIEEENPRLDFSRIDSDYTKALNQLDALERLKK